MQANEILAAMAAAYESKGCPGAPIAVSFDIDGDAGAWRLTASPEEGTRLEPGEHPNPEFIVVTTTELLRRLVQVGREWKLNRITAEILSENLGMQHVARQVGFECHYDIEDGVVKAAMQL